MPVIDFPEPPRKPRMDEYADALFQCLPAPSHQIIAQRMSKELGLKFKITYVGQVLLHVRIHSERLGWTIPHAGRGPQSEAVRSKDRFFAILVEKGKDPYLDPGHEIQLNKGAISTIQHVSSSMKHEGEALKLAAAYIQSVMAQKWTRSLARRVSQIADDAQELAGMISNGDK